MIFVCVDRDADGLVQRTVGVAVEFSLTIVAMMLAEGELRRSGSSCSKTTSSWHMDGLCTCCGLCNSMKLKTRFLQAKWLFIRLLNQERSTGWESRDIGHNHEFLISILLGLPKATLLSLLPKATPCWCPFHRPHIGRHHLCPGRAGLRRLIFPSRQSLGVATEAGNSE